MDVGTDPTRTRETRVEGTGLRDPRSRRRPRYFSCDRNSSTLDPSYKWSPGIQSVKSRVEKVKSKFFTPEIEVLSL